MRGQHERKQGTAIRVDGRPLLLLVYRKLAGPAPYRPACSLKGLCPRIFTGVWKGAALPYCARP